MRLPIALLLCLLAAFPARAQEDTPAAQRAFAETMMPELREAYPQATLEMVAGDPLTITVHRAAEEDDATLFLHRIYNFCRGNPGEECDRVRREYVAAMSAPSAQPAATALRILVRDREYVDYIRSFLPQDQQLEYRQIGDDLYALLALDSPTTIGIATPDHLRDFGIDQPTAWAMAHDQTRDILPPMIGAAEIGDSVHVYADFEYLPSMLYPVEAWSGLADAVGPDLFVTAVSDYLVLVGVLPDADMPRFAELVRQDCLQQPRCVTPHVYRYRDGKWTIAD